MPRRGKGKRPVTKKNEQQPKRGRYFLEDKCIAPDSDPETDVDEEVSKILHSSFIDDSVPSTPTVSPIASSSEKSEFRIRSKWVLLTYPRCSLEPSTCLLYTSDAADE